MADNNGSMTYPILFDLEAGVKKAAEDWDNKYADKLEKAIQKRALEVILKFDTTKLDTLDQVKQRLAQLKIEPMTPETKTAIKDLVRELNALAKAMEKVQKYSNIQTPELQQALANKANAEATHMAEKYRQANERVEIAKRRVTLAEQKHAEAMFQTAKAGKRQSEVYQEQTTYLNRLLKRMAVYWSVSTVQSFLTNVREVTAQFELQRVSLGAIIQDQNRANALFAEIKSFALKSPVKILDLTKYTKQVAAYGFETEKLFDTTKRLADISVGLGADMSRATLFLGQVYASNYLRAAELRQATELGIPLVDKLAKKLEELNGRAYSAAEVMDLISKRAISYELVEQIFKDMTSAGGEFYNMQERQGNTLYGMWSKLGDAAAMMYDEIGNTSFINSGMKDAIGLLAELMKNWRYFGNAILMVVPTMLLVHNIEKARAANSARQIAAMNTLTAATTRRIAAEKALNNAITSGLANTAAKARMNLILAQTEEKVAQKALTAGNSIGLLGKRLNLFGGALQKLSAFVATNFWTVLLTGVTLLTSALVSANEKANRLKNTLAEIGSAGELEIYQSKENFVKLADAAVHAATGSKKQRDALDELHRTYRDMIPAQDMTLEKLTAMEGDYRKLTIAVEEYIRARLKQQQIEAVTSEIGADLAKAEKKMTEDAKGFYYTYNKGATKLKLNYDQIQLLIKGIKEIAKAERSLPTRKVFAKALTDYVGLDPKGLEVGLDEWLNTFDDGLFAIVRHTREFEAELDRIEANEKLDTTLGKYAEGWKKVNERIDNLTVKGAKVGTFTYDQATINASIKQYKGYLKEVLGNAWDESFASIEEHVGKNGDKLSALFIEKMMAPEYWDKLTVAQQQAILKVKKAYEGLIPTDRTVNILREKLQDISTLYGMSMDIAKQFRMNAGETIEDYAKRVKSSLEDAQNSLKELQFNKSQMDAGVGVGVGVLKPVSDEELKDADTLVKVLSALFELISGFTKSKSGGRRSDPRLQNLKEEISLVQKLYNEYKQLEKQEGASKAAEDMERMAKASLDMLSKKYGISLPTTAKDLMSALEILYKKMAALPKKVFPALDKELNELRWTIEKVNIDDSQKNIEQQLKSLADRINRTKTAKEFYDKVLSQTGDVELAKSISLSIYGDDGAKLFEQTVEHIKEVFKSGNADVVIDVDAAIDTKNQRINYKMLADIYDKYQNDIIEKNRDTAQKIVSEGQKTAASNALTWQEELAKAKSFEEKRSDIIKTESERRANIIKSNLPKEVKQQQITLSYDKQGQDLAKLAVDEFKNSDDFIKVFQDLDRVSTQTLDRMKKRLEEMIGTVKDTENVEGLKSLVEQLDKIKEERETRNPIEGVISSFKEYAKARKDYRTAEANEATVRAAYEKEKVALDQAVTDAKTEQEAAQARVTELEKQGLLETNEGVAAQLALNDATTKVTQATEKRNKAVKKVNDAEQATTDALDAQKAAIAKLQKNVNAMANAFNSAASSIQTIADLIGVAEDSELGDIVNGLVSGLQNAATIMTTILAIAIAIESACWWLLAIGAAVSVFSALGSWLTGSKVRKANKEIERQQELLEQLEYTYGRLEKAAEKAFGGDYISNFKQQQKNLEAQAAAYQRQAEAERSKGKDTDENKVREYENAYRDTLDAIADMQGKIAEQMAGTDVASAARDFAQAWLEAYASFGNTTGAIKDKFKDMIKSMVVESVMGKVVQQSLQPMFDEMNEMYLRGDSTTKVLSYAFRRSSELAEELNRGLLSAAREAEAAGVDLKGLYQTSDNMKGISRETAGASEESVNANTAALTTQNYYVSHLPTISENVAAMRMLMEGGASTSIPTATAGWTDWQQQAMDNYVAIQRNTADMVVECRNIAAKCQAQTELLKKVIVPKGVAPSYWIYVKSDR